MAEAARKARIADMIGRILTVESRSGPFASDNARSLKM
jgi:hypothetical protein